MITMGTLRRIQSENDAESSRQCNARDAIRVPHGSSTISISRASRSMTNNNHGVAAVDDTNNKDLSIEESGNALPLSVIGDADTLIRCIEEAHLEANRSFADSVQYARRAGDAAIQLKALGRGHLKSCAQKANISPRTIRLYMAIAKEFVRVEKALASGELGNGSLRNVAAFLRVKKQALPSPNG